VTRWRPFTSRPLASRVRVPTAPSRSRLLIEGLSSVPDRSAELVLSRRVLVEVGEDLIATLAEFSPRCESTVPTFRVRPSFAACPSSPRLLIPVVRISKSASRNGGASLLVTTLTFTRATLTLSSFTRSADRLLAQEYSRTSSRT